MDGLVRSIYQKQLIDNNYKSYNPIIIILILPLNLIGNYKKKEPIRLTPCKTMDENFSMGSTQFGLSVRFDLIDFKKLSQANLTKSKLILSRF